MSKKKKKLKKKPREMTEEEMEKMEVEEEQIEREVEGEERIRKEAFEMIECKNCIYFIHGSGEEGLCAATSQVYKGEGNDRDHQFPYRDLARTPYYGRCREFISILGQKTYEEVFMDAYKAEFPRD
jgi:hypothetical protein